MPLDETPYFNPKAVALPVSGKPAFISQTSVIVKNLSESTGPESSDKDALEVSRRTQQLMDFLNAHYQLRYNSIMGYTECKDNDYKYMEWTPVDDRMLKGPSLKLK